jgi:arylsulfatase A-like enzyme
MQRPTMVIAFAAACALAACDTPTSGRTSTLPVVQHVVLVSIDGLRADAMRDMPALSSLAERGLWTDSMQTVVPALTVPGHLSMLTGRDVTTLGVRINEIDSTAALGLIFGGVSTVFDWTRGGGGTSEAIAGANLISRTLREGAQAFFGVDTLIATDASGDVIMDRAIAALRAPNPPTLLFIHVPDADVAGHESGWIVPGELTADHNDVLSVPYLAAVGRIDSSIARLWDVVAPDVEAGRTALIVTADHGGGHGDGCTASAPAYKEHCTVVSGDRLIPFVLVARGLEPRRLEGTPRITQVGPTIAALLHVWRPRKADRAVEF